MPLMKLHCQIGFNSPTPLAESREILPELKQPQKLSDMQFKSARKISTCSRPTCTCAVQDRGDVHSVKAYGRCHRGNAGLIR